MIPKVLIQTSKDPLPHYVVEMISDKLSPGWKYYHFNHEQRLKWITENLSDEFPTLLQKYQSMSNGAHQSDLFRYYYLYKNGGVYLDSDAMLEVETDQLCGDARFVGVITPYGNTFNGLLACTPQHPVVYRALIDVLQVNNSILSIDYYVFCRNLYYFIHEYGPNNDGMKVLTEHQVTADGWGSFDVRGICQAMHYPNTKIIPGKIYQ